MTHDDDTRADDRARADHAPHATPRREVGTHAADAPASSPGTREHPGKPPESAPPADPGKATAPQARATTANDSPDRPVGGTRPASGAKAARVGGAMRAPRVPRQRVPVLLWLPALLGLGFVVLPLVGLLVRAPWQSVPERLGDPAVRTALRLSVQCSFGALGISLVLGVPLAWLFARVEFPGKSLLRALVLLPLVLPPVVGGVALLLAFGRKGLLGPWLESMGIRLTFSMTGAMLAGAFVALPFLVLSVEGAIAGLDRRYEETAATLGAGPLRVFCTVTLPLIAPGLAAGAALAWARALGEFGATITFAGNLPGETQTLPLAVYLMLQDDPDTAVAVSLLLLVVSVVVLVALRGRWLSPSRRGPERVPRSEEAG